MSDNFVILLISSLRFWESEWDLDALWMLVHELVREAKMHLKVSTWQPSQQVLWTHHYEALQQDTIRFVDCTVRFPMPQKVNPDC